MEVEKLTLKKGDYFILALVLCIVMVLWFCVSKIDQGNKVHVTVDGNTTTYSLFEKETLSFTEGNLYVSDRKTDGDNVIVIENGQVYMRSANCPDQVCVKHKPISKNGEMIICLPNEVYIEIESDTVNEIDN